MLIFDIGSNVGEYLAHCMQHIPGSKVICVDANPHFRNLYETTNPFQDRYTFVNKLICSTEKGKQEFFLDPGQSGISTASREFMENSRFKKGSKNLPPDSGTWLPTPIMIEATTIDKLIEEYGTPNVIKIDVEGFELEAVLGLSQKVDLLHLEWHEEMFEETQQVVSHLESIGFTEFAISGYFDEGDIFDKLRYDNQGDNYAYRPSRFYPWKEIMTEDFINPERRINYGMLFAR